MVQERSGPAMSPRRPTPRVLVVTGADAGVIIPVGSIPPSLTCAGLNASPLFDIQTRLNTLSPGKNAANV
ncbi:hypothetical protein E2C01_012222 [Portunus trituberculatus]|uniref:Uncharacterized protein n=1 Tax=Portunus trituberculatus TaxID=210409 RepID=A0A5B7DDK1_PORTR|nr:hypothetical protein [Portunus trituberculatus]